MKTKAEKFNFKNGSENLTSHSGLTLIGMLLSKSGIGERLNDIVLPDMPSPIISHSDVLLSMIGTLSLGKSSFDDVERHRDNQYFKNAIGIDTVPSSSTLRERIGAAKGAFDVSLKAQTAEFIKEHCSPGNIWVGNESYVPLDIDVTPMDNSKTNKEGVSRTYKGYFGFAPIMAYIGKDGYLINAELREGKQHCQKGTPEFLEETLRLAKSATDSEILVRLDSGNDASENFVLMNDAEVKWICKLNPRSGGKQKWWDIAENMVEPIVLRKGQMKYTGVKMKPIDGSDKEMAVVFDVTVTDVLANGQMLITPEVEVDLYGTNLIKANENNGVIPLEEIIELYHAHGESEQFHSEIKTDMDIERLPSNNFQSNSLVLLLSMWAYNMLRLIGLEGVVESIYKTDSTMSRDRKKVTRRRLRTVLLDVIYLAGRIIRSGRTWSISFGRHQMAADAFSVFCKKFAT